MSNFVFEIMLQVFFVTGMFTWLIILLAFVIYFYQRLTK